MAKNRDTGFQFANWIDWSKYTKIGIDPTYIDPADLSGFTVTREVPKSERVAEIAAAKEDARREVMDARREAQLARESQAASLGDNMGLNPGGWLPGESNQQLRNSQIQGLQNQAVQGRAMPAFTTYTFSAGDPPLGLFQQGVLSRKGKLSQPTPEPPKAAPMSKNGRCIRLVEPDE